MERRGARGVASLGSTGCRGVQCAPVSSSMVVEARYQLSVSARFILINGSLQRWNVIRSPTIKLVRTRLTSHTFLPLIKTCG